MKKSRVKPETQVLESDADAEHQREGAPTLKPTLNGNVQQPNNSDIADTKNIVESAAEPPKADNGKAGAQAAGVKFYVDFTDGATLKIIGQSDRLFEVQFVDTRTRQILFKRKVKANTSSKTEVKYCTDCLISVRSDTGEVLHTQTFNPEGKRVLIAFESGALGDTLAWMPYVELFRQKYNCDVVCSTQMNRLFKSAYPEIEFTAPGMPVEKVYAVYNVGWYLNDKAKSPQSAHVRPLQGLAADILNVPFREIKPRLDFKPGRRPLSKRYVCIATHAGATHKLWNNQGWQELVIMLRSCGAEVVAISKEGCDLENVLSLGELPLESVMNWIHHSEFVVGLSSGLAWLSWALDKHVVMIANFSQDGHEFVSGVTRITNTSVCHGCWNDPELPFQSAVSEWCPRLKGTPQMFECHTAITADDVIAKIGVLVERLKERSV